MPIYEYRCLDCGKVTEILVRSLKNDNESACSGCGGRNLEKILSAPGGLISRGSAPKGLTCCGSTERCDTPPCSSGGSCRRD